jgi:predicted ester cyclase
MTHNGDGLGFPATGKKADFAGSSFITCRDGQLTDGWNFMDLTKMTLDLHKK